MSNTNSSPPSADDRVRRDAVRAMVEQRAGRRWCLFLDRDGVINRQVVGDYVRDRHQFHWLPSALRALALLRAWAPRLVVVTNQQGVGKGLMTIDDVAAIHDVVQSELRDGGDPGIDAFHVCPHLETAGCACRKPRPGLVLDWLSTGDTDPSLSIVVGDSASDIGLARNVAAAVGNCASVHIGRNCRGGCGADVCFETLWDFATAVDHERGGEVA